MHYKQNTKMTKKQLNKIRLMGLFILLFIFTSCGEGGEWYKYSHQEISEEGQKIKAIKNTFLERLGGWGPCDYNSLLDKVIADARTGVGNGKGKIKTLADGTQTFVIPTKTPRGNNYLKELGAQQEVDRPSAPKWYQIHKRVDSKKRRSPYVIQDGIHGLMETIYKEFLHNYNETNVSKQARFFVVAKYLEFLEKVRKNVENITDKNSLIIQLRSNLADFKKEIEKVEKYRNARGIEAIIPINSIANAKNGGLIFKNRSEITKSKGNKKYVLTKDLQARIEEICLQVEQQINKLESDLP